MKTPHILIQDDSSHWYLILEEFKEDFYSWSDAMCDCADWDGRDYAVYRIDGPLSIRILEWEKR
jgi:hypothetical protein